MWHPTKSLPSHSPTISKLFSATHLKICKGPSQELSWTNVLMGIGPSTKVARCHTMEWFPLNEHKLVYKNIAL